MLDHILTHFKTFEEVTGKIEIQYKLKIKSLGMRCRGEGNQGRKNAIKDKFY